KIAYSQARFSKDGEGILVTTDRDSEFHRLAYIDLANGKRTYLIPTAKFDVDDWDLSADGKSIAYTFNENGRSTLHIANVSAAKSRVFSTSPTHKIFPGRVPPS